MTVRAFHPRMESIVEGAQRQRLEPIYWDADDGNLPGSQLCAVRIVMPPGWVSMPHVHDTVQVSVTLDSAWYGVLTLCGPELDRAVWLSPGGVLAIMPGDPHIALYPKRRPDNGEQVYVDAIATETRNTPDWRTDVRPLPELITMARRTTNRRGIEDLFDWPRTT